MKIDLNDRAWRTCFDAAVRVAKRHLDEDQFVIVTPINNSAKPGIFVGDPQRRKGIILRPSVQMAHHVEVSELQPGIAGKEVFRGTHHLQEVM